VTVPDAYTGEVISDLNVKRGRILGMSPDNGVTQIEAEVPLAGVQRYAQGLRSVSHGRGPTPWSLTTTTRHQQTWKSK